MGVGAGFYMHDIVKSSRSLSHFLNSACISFQRGSVLK